MVAAHKKGKPASRSPRWGKWGEHDTASEILGLDSRGFSSAPADVRRPESKRPFKTLVSHHPFPSPRNAELGRGTFGKVLPERAARTHRVLSLRSRREARGTVWAPASGTHALYGRGSPVGLHLHSHSCPPKPKSSTQQGPPPTDEVTKERAEATRHPIAAPTPEPSHRPFRSGKAPRILTLTWKNWPDLGTAQWPTPGAGDALKLQSKHMGLQWAWLTSALGHSQPPS